jgi:hypothetical protein
MNFEIPDGWNQIYVDVFADLEKAKSKEIKLNHLSKEEEEHRRVGNRLKRLRRRHLINAAPKIYIELVSFQKTRHVSKICQLASLEKLKF